MASSRKSRASLIGLNAKLIVDDILNNSHTPEQLTAYIHSFPDNVWLPILQRLSEATGEKPTMDKEEEVKEPAVHTQTILPTKPHLVAVLVREQIQ
jgi:hypothetical protein